VDEVFYATLATPIGEMHIASTGAGVCKVALPSENAAEFMTWLKRALPGATLIESEEANAAAIDELQAYLQGRLTEFSSPLDMHGTDFQRAVWQAVAAIPYGETRSYGEIARSVDRPLACRAVGAANGANPLPPFVPCHRVIGGNGSLTGYGGGLPLKARLLDLERTVRQAFLPSMAPSDAGQDS
jgi:methylated-DNA-[protein]-cysteine S-methyltransferase